MFVKNLDLKPRGPRCRGMTCEIERKLNSGYRPPRFGADLPNDERPQCLRTQHTRLLSVLSHTVLSKRAPEEVLLAVRGAHPSLPKTETTRA